MQYFNNIFLEKKEEERASCQSAYITFVDLQEVVGRLWPALVEAVLAGCACQAIA